MIQLSEAAVAEVQRMQLARERSHCRLRLRVQTGGCCGLYYDLSLDPTLFPRDRVSNAGGIEVVIDADSSAQLDGLKIDYTEDLMGGGFRFSNPQAVAICGCGQSFAIADPA